MPVPAKTSKSAIFYVKQKPKSVVEVLEQASSEAFVVEVIENRFSVKPVGPRFLPRARMVGTVQPEGYGSKIEYELKGRFSLVVPLVTIGLLVAYGVCRLALQMLMPANLESGLVAGKGFVTFLVLLSVAVAYISSRREDERKLVEFVRARLPENFDA